MATNFIKLVIIILKPIKKSFPKQSLKVDLDVYDLSK